VNRRSWRRAIFLFTLTLLSTFIVGANMVRWHPERPDVVDPFNLVDGWVFALPLLGILLCHELGHYFLARRHRVEVSPPYFIPFPNLIGTMGAFIAIRSPIYNRRQLLDIGAAGPLAGFVPSVLMLALGYSLSTVALPPAGLEGAISFGDSLITWGIQSLMIGPVPEGHVVWIHPVGFAGWVGLFVTMLNLAPAGSLDGGHITYALLGRRQWWIAPAAVLAVVVLGLLVASWWFYILVFWVFLYLAYVLVARLFFRVRIPLSNLYRGRMLRHPPVPDEEPLDALRAAVGWFCFILFLLCFVPAPIQMATLGG
jgi:membrane-associated protease RseP (regulator of RpoE activity)